MGLSILRGPFTYVGKIEASPFAGDAAPRAFGGRPVVI